MLQNKRGFGVSALTPQGQKKRSKSITGDDVGNDTFDLNGVRDERGKAYGLSGKTKMKVA